MKNKLARRNKYGDNNLERMEEEEKIMP